MYLKHEAFSMMDITVLTGRLPFVNMCICA